MEVTLEMPWPELWLRAKPAPPLHGAAQDLLQVSSEHPPGPHPRAAPPITTKGVLLMPGAGPLPPSASCLSPCTSKKSQLHLLYRPSPGGAPTCSRGSIRRAPYPPLLPGHRRLPKPGQSLRPLTCPMGGWEPQAQGSGPPHSSTSFSDQRSGQKSAA